MKKLTLLLLIFVISISCENQNPELIQPDEPVVLSEEQSFEIVNSYEYQTYFALRYEFLKLVETALDNGYSAEELAQISGNSINRGDHETFYQTIFNDPSKGEKYVENLNIALVELYTKFPILNSITSETEANLSESEIYGFYKNLEVRSFNRNDFNNARTEEVVCGSYWQQAKLLACAGLCGASTAGAGAVLCGWACWCMLCPDNSAVSDAIC